MSIAPPWNRRWKLYGSRMPNVLPQWLKQRTMPLKAGSLLVLILLLGLFVSGCSTTTVVREVCPPPPLPPASLMQKPLNYDLIPKSALPSKSARTGLQMP